MDRYSIFKRQISKISISKTLAPGGMALFFFLYLLVCSQSIFAGHTPNDESLFVKGLQEKEKGNYEEALTLWLDYVDCLSDPQFRVSQEFIRLVTKEEKKSYYPKASELYYWGLQAGHVSEEDKKALLAEIKYLQPLLGQREYRSLRNQINNADPEVYKRLNDFWRNLDLTIDESYNERLLEHWERVNFAYEAFDSGERGEFDDRGAIYIRYGKPDRDSSGMFQHNPGFVNSVVSQRLSDGGSGLDAGSAAETTAFLNTMYMVRNYHNYPVYEIWVYTDYLDRDDSVIYIFGNSHGGTRMSLMKSVDDFIPSAAYSSAGRNNPNQIQMSNRRGAGGNSESAGRSGSSDIELDDFSTGSGSQEFIPPALIMQLMYYRQLAAVDEYFGFAYDEMMDRYSNVMNRISSSLPREFQHLNSAEILIRQSRAPAEASTHINNLFQFDADMYTYRFLDEDLTPYLRLFPVTDTEEAVHFSELRKRNNLQDIRYDEYKIVKALNLFDKDGERQLFLVDSTDVTVGQDVDPVDHQSLQVVHTPEITEAIARIELHNNTEYGEDNLQLNGTFRPHLKGIGEVRVSIPPVLETEEFTVSDVIFGYKAAEEGEDEVPFSISHDRMVPENSIISIYYEAYNIPQTGQDIYSYELTYKIKPKRSRFSWFGLRSSNEMSVTIENISDESRFHQNLDIFIQELLPRDYVMELTFSMDDSDIEYQREIGFTIKD